MRIRALVVIVVCATGMAGQTPDELRTMREANRDFVLRDAVERGGSDIPPLYRGLVEASENRVGAAERDLQQVLKSDPHS
jgi:hypothetical protein